VWFGVDTVMIYVSIDIVSDVSFCNLEYDRIGTDCPLLVENRLIAVGL
jgi:hypothetical protein